jgi:general secretion pathway protein H
MSRDVATVSDVTRNESGMSLLETIIVLAILSLVLAVVLPGSTVQPRGTELRAVAQNVMSELRATRAHAIARNRATAMTIDVRQGRYLTEADGRWHQLPGGITFVTSTPAAAVRTAGQGRRIVFFGDGSSTGGTVRLQRDRASLDVAVDWLTGFVKIGTPS